MHRRGPHRISPTLAAAAAVSILASLPACVNLRERPSAPKAASRPSVKLTAEPYVAAGEQAVREGATGRALALFERAIEINPRLTQAHLGMADIFRMSGDYSRAAGSYGRAAEVEPRNFDAQFYYGLMLHLLDRVTEAIQAYVKALAVKPDDFRTNVNLSTAYYQLEENAQALEYGKRAVELDPQDGSARFNLGAIYAAMGRHAEAVQEYQQAAEHMELGGQLLLNLAESLGKLGRFDEMVNALEELIRHDPSPAAYERLGFAKFKLAKYDEAEGRFAEALAVDPDYYPALNGLGVCLLNKWVWSEREDADAKARGIAALRKSLQIRRDQPQIVELLARYGR